MAKNEKTMDGRARYFGELKAKCKDAILLFRCGDFYEAYYEDAKVVADVCGITLTRENGNGGYMCGFPHHALDTYLPKLVRAGKRVAICDQIINETTNQNNETTMAKNETTNAQQYVGKVIIVGDDIATIEIKGVQDNGMLNCEFKKGDQPAIHMPVTIPNLEGMIAKGVWRFKGEAPKATATEEVQEVEDVQPTKPTAKATEKETEKPQGKAKEVKMEPKAKRSEKRKVKSEKPATETKAEKEPKAKPEVLATGTLTYETYTSKKGKTCAKISGFGENDPAYVNATELHGSASWNTTKEGRVLCVAFGAKYVAKAKEVCDALNAGKSFNDCKAIIDGPSEPKTYTEAEVADLIRRVVAGDQAAIDTVNAMAKKAA